MIALVIVGHGNQPIKAAMLNTMMAATQCDGDVHVLAAGADCSAAAQAAVQIAGVTRVLVTDAPQFADGLAENIVEQTLAVAGNYNHVLASTVTYGKNILPHVAIKLDVAQLSDITKVDGPGTFEHPIYAGNTIVTVQSADKVKVITAHDTAFDPTAAIDGAAAAENPTAVAGAGISQFVSQGATKSNHLELTAAKVIASGGRDVGSGENYTKVLTPLADKLGVALDTSRAATNAGFVPSDYQAGQAGKITTSQLYITVGISGVIQYLAGTKGPKVVVAIDKDPEAPIFQMADYGLVGGLNAIVPKLVTALG